MILEWSPFALADRNEIFDHIETDSPRTAIVVDNAIRDQVARLTDFPDRGRPGRVMNSRELVLVGLPYIVAYRIDGKVIRILRVLHGAQQWPDSLPG